MKRNAILAALAAALIAAVGCIPVAHVELEDGSWVSFVGPEEMPYSATGPCRTTADGRKVRTARADCTASRDVGLKGVVSEQSWEAKSEAGGPCAVFLRTLTLSNVSGEPITLKRVVSYAHIPGERLAKPAADGSRWRTATTCDPAKGFVIPDLKRKGERVTLVAETPGFTHSLTLLARNWRIEGDTVVYPLPTMNVKPRDKPLAVDLPDWLVAEGAEVVARPLGGGKPFATVHPSMRGSGACRCEFTGLPVMFPLELVFKAAPGAKDRAPTEAWPQEPGMELKSGAPVYALAGEKPLNVTLAPGETLAFTMRMRIEEPPGRGDTRR